MIPRMPFLVVEAGLLLAYAALLLARRRLASPDRGTGLVLGAAAAGVLTLLSWLPLDRLVESHARTHMWPLVAGGAILFVGCLIATELLRRLMWVHHLLLPLEICGLFLAMDSLRVGGGPDFVWFFLLAALLSAVALSLLGIGVWWLVARARCRGPSPVAR